MSVTKHSYLNVVIGLLVAASLVLMCVPCYEVEANSTSVMGYICFPSNYPEVTELFKAGNPDFSLNNQVWMPILTFLLGILSIAMLILKRNFTASLIAPMFFSVCGIICCWTNELMRAGDMTVLPTVLMLATLILCLFNSSWGADSSDWKASPDAGRKLKEISKASSKKNIDSLIGLAQSKDPTVCAAAIRAIGQVGGGKAFQALVIHLSSSNPDVRIAAAGALGELGDQRGRTYLKHFMETDQSAQVRDAMRAALAMLPTQSD